MAHNDAVAGHFDTIFALITAPGRAAVAVVRVAGPGALAVARQVFSGLPDAPVSHVASFGEFVTGDDGLALYFAPGRGYTGEEAIELMIHGSPASLSALLLACESAGARPALPGEFTRRAFLNGRLDLTQAEAVRDTVDAETSAQFRAANRVRQGHLQRRVREIAAPIMDVLVAVEASVDFSEEIGHVDAVAARAKLAPALHGIHELLATANLGRISREGAVIALLGAPNAGKSSLLNALLGRDRALVTPIAGTTRDTVEEIVELDGLPCRLIDTAGLRDTTDAVEELGIARSREAAANADFNLFLVDAEAGWTPATRTEFDRVPEPKMAVLNKIDLAPGADGISAKTGAGLSELRESIRAKVLGQAVVGDISINARHQPLLERAVRGVQMSMECLASDQPDDLASVGLRDALQALGEITGEHVADDILDRIFHDFCIGK